MQHPAQPGAMGVGRGRAPLSSSHGWLPFTSMLRQAFSPLIPGATPGEGIMTLPRGTGRLGTRAKQGKR